MATDTDAPLLCPELIEWHGVGVIGLLCLGLLSFEL
jgi:hypothetical protein